MSKRTEDAPVIDSSLFHRQEKQSGSDGDGKNGGGGGEAKANSKVCVAMDCVVHTIYSSLVSSLKLIFRTSFPRRLQHILIFVFIPSFAFLFADVP